MTGLNVGVVGATGQVGAVVQLMSARAASDAAFITNSITKGAPCPLVRCATRWVQLSSRIRGASMK